MYSPKLFLGGWIIVAVLFFIAECLAVGWNMASFTPGANAPFIVFVGLMIASPVIAYWIDHSVEHLKLTTNVALNSTTNSTISALETVGLL